MVEFVAGFLVGAFLATGWGVAPVPVGLLGGLGVYLLSCAVYPFRPCPWCRDNRKRSDDRGNYRIKGCWLCGGERYVRLGARFLGRG